MTGPLPPGSPKLRRRRVEVDVLGDPQPLTGGRRLLTPTARFATIADAQAWADAEWADAPYVRLTLHAAARGWVSQPGPVRRDGEWETPTL